MGRQALWSLGVFCRVVRQRAGCCSLILQVCPHTVTPLSYRSPRAKRPLALRPHPRRQATNAGVLPRYPAPADPQLLLF